MTSAGLRTPPVRHRPGRNNEPTGFPGRFSCRLAAVFDDRVLKSATIEFDRGAYSCAVRNLSEAGAALDVPHALAIPHEFKLITETDQASRHCRVIWRKENRIGVAFAQVDNQPLAKRAIENPPA